MNKIYLVSMLAIISLGSCSQTDDGTTNEAVNDSTAIIEEPTRVTYILPSPYQIAEMFRRAGLTYEAGLTLDPTASANFNSSFHKNLAFGIYSADMAYVTVNQQNQEGLDYLRVIRSLANELGYGKVFDSESFFQRFETNLGNEDSIAFLLGDLQLAMTDLLAENEEDYISPIIFAAAWTESMYLGVKHYESKKGEGLYNKLQEQQILLENVLSALESHVDKAQGIAPLVERLRKIDTAMRAQEGPEADYTTLREAIISVREDMVNGKI